MKVKLFSKIAILLLILLLFFYLYYLPKEIEEFKTIVRKFDKNYVENKLIQMNFPKHFLNIPIDNDGNTFLSEAIHFSQKETVELLIKYGADIKIRNKLGQDAKSIAIEQAKRSGRDDIVNMLETYSN